MDYEILKASDGTGEAALATIQSNRSIAATVIEVDTLDNWPASFIVVTGTLDANGYITPASMTQMVAHEDSGDIIIDSFVPGYTDIGNTSGQVAIIKQNTYWVDQMIEGAQVAHDDDGKLKVNAPITGGSTIADGWISAEPSSAWAYSAWDSGTKIAQITVPTDATTKYQPGDRVKFTQTTDGVKYGIIVKVEATTLHVFMHDDDDFDNETISAPFFSRAKNPFGFDSDPTKWLIETTDTSLRSQSTPTASQWYNLGSLSITIPIGAWLVGYEVGLGFQRDANQCNAYATLSKANNTEDDAEYTSGIAQVVAHNTGGNSLALTTTAKREKHLILTAEDEYFLNSMSTYSTAGSISFAGNVIATRIYALCAYL